MTNNPHPFKEFSDILAFYQSPTTGTSTRTPTKNINASRCLQCQRQISLSRFSPYCSESCMSKHDAGIQGATTEVKDNNVMRHFSEVFSQ